MQSNDDEGSPLQYSDSSPAAMDIIRSGLRLRGEDSSRSFWDDFLQMCSNSDGFAELLDVRPEQVAKWTSRIREMMDKVEKSEEQDSADKKNILQTGIV